MAYTRELKAVVPVLIDEHTKADDELLVWLVRESFEREAAAEYLTLTEWRDCGDLHPSEVTPDRARGAQASGHRFPLAHVHRHCHEVG